MEENTGCTGLVLLYIIPVKRKGNNDKWLWRGSAKTGKAGVVSICKADRKPR